MNVIPDNKVQQPMQQCRRPGRNRHNRKIDRLTKRFKLPGVFPRLTDQEKRRLYYQYQPGSREEKMTYILWTFFTTATTRSTGSNGSRVRDTSDDPCAGPGVCVSRLSFSEDSAEETWSFNSPPRAATTAESAASRATRVSW